MTTPRHHPLTDDPVPTRLGCLAGLTLCALSTTVTVLAIAWLIRLL